MGYIGLGQPNMQSASLHRSLSVLVYRLGNLCDRGISTTLRVWSQVLKLIHPFPYVYCQVTH